MSSGGIDELTGVDSGGTLNVLSGGLSPFGINVVANGTLIVSLGGTTSNATTWGLFEVEGGTAIGTVVSSGGIYDVGIFGSGGFASGSIVESGGDEGVFTGATAS